MTKYCSNQNSLDYASIFRRTLNNKEGKDGLERFQTIVLSMSSPVPTRPARSVRAISRGSGRTKFMSDLHGAENNVLLCVLYLKSTSDHKTTSHYISHDRGAGHVKHVGRQGHGHVERGDRQEHILPLKKHVCVMGSLNKTI